MSTKESVTIKVPRVPDYIRKEKKEVKIHMEEAKKLMATPFRKPRHENLVRYLNVAYDDFRKEIWVVGFIFTESFHIYLRTNFLKTILSFYHSFLTKLLPQVLQTFASSISSIILYSRQRCITQPFLIGLS